MSARAEHPFFADRLLLARVIAALAISVLVVRLWYLQGINGAHFRDLSENNRTRTIRTAAPRGYIFDREGRILVRNRASFNIALIMEDTPDVKATIHELAAISGRSEQDLQGQLDARRVRSPFEPKVVMPDVSREELARIMVNNYRLPGVIVNVSPARAYPYGTMAAQVFGYAREITKSQLEEREGKNYASGDIVGQTGLETQWEDKLRGRAGYVQVEVDAMGNRKGELGIADDRAGDDLHLTLDLDLQVAAEAAIAGKRAATIAMDPNTGEILALASSPSFDPNNFAGQLKAEDWKRYSSDKARPLTNRVISQVYPVGSTFKLILALAGLAEKKVTPSTIFNCPGYYTFAGRRYHCHKASGHGAVNLQYALTVSCNSYFFQLGQALGITGIHKYASLLGLGATSGVDLPGEEEGVMPSEQWKLKKFGERWYPGETLSVSIGQGYVAVTPIQMAMAMATIANSGTVYRPHIVQEMVDNITGERTKVTPQIIRKLDVPESVFKTVRDFSTQVVNDARGTGRRAMLDGIIVGGKTGTAQVSGLGKGKGPEFDDHAWFLSFAPADNPMIVTATIVENGGHGGVAAAPVSKEIMTVFFKKKGMLVEPPPAEGAEKASSKSDTGAEARPEEAPHNPDSADSEDLPPQLTD